MAKEVSLLVNIRGKTSKAASNSKDTLSGIARLANTGGYLMALKNISSALINVTKNQADYIESINLMQVAFGETSEKATEFVNSLAEISGFDPMTLTQSLGTFREMSSALGYTAETADLLSTNLLKMQLDLSSLYNMDLDKVASKLQSAMAGQTKAVRAFGADITEASLQQEAYNRGISKSVSEMTRAEKTIMIYLTLEKQLADSNGDASRTINSVSNQLRILADQFTIAGRNIGGFFIPILKSILPILNGILMAFNSIIGTILGLLGIDAVSLASEFGGASAGADDLANSLDNVADSASKAGKAADKSLRSFDKLNVIKTPSSGGGGGGASGGGGGIDPSILNALKAYDLGEFQSKANEIKQQILDFLDLEKTAGMTAVQTAEYVGKRIAEGLNLITEKIKWAEIGQKLANGINVALRFLVSFVETYDWFNLGKSIAIFVNNAIENVNWTDAGKLFASKWKIVIDTLSGFIQKLNFNNIGNAIADFINGAMSMINVNNLVKGINALSKGLFDAIFTALKNIKWGELIKKAIQLISGLDIKTYLLLLAPTFINAFGFFTNTVKDAVIGKVTTKSKNWILGLFNLDEPAKVAESINKSSGKLKIPNPKEILKGLADLALIIAAVESIILAYGALNKIPGYTEFKSDGVKNMVLTFEGISKIAIPLAGTAAAVTLISKVPIKTILSGLADMALIIIGTEAIIAAVGLIASISNKVTQGTATMVNLFESIGKIAIPLAETTALIVVLGFVSPVTVLSGLAGFALIIGGLELLLVALGGLSQIPGFNWIVGEGSKVLSQLGETLGNFAGSIVAGFVGKAFEGLESVGTSLANFMNNAKPFFDGLSSINESTANASKSLASAILHITAANLLEGITRWISGKGSMAKFGQELSQFAPHFKSYANTISGVDSNVVEKSSKAVEAMAKVSELAPKKGGLVSLLAGENSMAVFGLELSLFAPLFKSYYNNVKNINGDVVQKSADAAEALAVMAKKIPNKGGLVSLFTGDNSISSFGKDLKKFGEYFKDYYSKVKEISISTINNVSNAFGNLVNYATTIKSKSLSSVMSDFGNSLKTASVGMSTFFNNTFSNTNAANLGWSFGTTLGTNIKNAMTNKLGTSIKLLDSGTTVKTLKLSAYADGGFPEMGQMFLAREAGPELVGTIGSKSAVANNDQIVEGIRQATMSGFMDAMQYSGKQNVNVNITAEGDTSGLMNFITFKQKGKDRQYGL